MLEKSLAFGDPLNRITSLQPWWRLKVPPARAGFSYQPRLQHGEMRVREMSQRRLSSPEHEAGALTDKNAEPGNVWWWIGPGNHKRERRMASLYVAGCGGGPFPEMETG